MPMCVHFILNKISLDLKMVKKKKFINKNTFKKLEKEKICYFLYENKTDSSSLLMSFYIKTLQLDGSFLVFFSYYTFFLKKTI